MVGLIRSRIASGYGKKGWLRDWPLPGESTDRRERQVLADCAV